MLEELVLKVGKREIDDKKKIAIKGALVKPDRKADLGILFITGFYGRWEDYMQYFSSEIGEIWPIYTTEIRKGGFTTGNLIAKDLCQIDEQIRDRLETNNMIYFGHSLGLPLGIEATKRHLRQVLGYVGMATYPSVGDCFNPNPNIANRNLIQFIVEQIAPITNLYNLAPLAFPLKESNVNEPIYFIIAEKDEFTLTVDPNVRKRFENYFDGFPKGSSVVIPGNHCFNQKYFKLKPFNQDGPRALITKVLYFMEQFT